MQIKRIIATAALAACLAAPARAEIDLEGMSLADLARLRDQITAAMWASDEWQEVTVPVGVYEIGKDIPAGYWTISAPDGSTCYLCWCSALDESGTDDAGFESVYSYEQVTSPSHRQYSAGDPTSVSWNLTGGYLIVKVAAVSFTPFTGHDLGFK
jgi:hypothetical protein